MTYLSREDVVSEFHRAFGHRLDQDINEKELILRYTLLAEEWAELKEEIAAALADLSSHGEVKRKTKERMLKEMADLQYVLSGMAATFGLPLQVAFVRVHKSNLSKLGEDGKPIFREDGKILKGSNYAPPDLEDLVKDTTQVPGYDCYNIGV